MSRTWIAGVAAILLVAGCSGIGGERVVVDRVGPDDLLKLRSGPGLGFNIIVGLPDGTEVIRRDCVTEVGQLWCRVALAENPSVTGYVAADYLTAR